MQPLWTPKVALERPFGPDNVTLLVPGEALGAPIRTMYLTLDGHVVILGFQTATSGDMFDPSFCSTRGGHLFN